MQKKHRDALDLILKESDPIEVAYLAIVAAMLDKEPRSRSKPATDMMLQSIAGFALGMNETHGDPPPSA